MKFLTQVSLTILLSYITAQFLPWWSLVICTAIVAMQLQLSPGAAFWGGFAAISLLWMGVATLIDAQTESILSSKIAPLLGFQSSILLILLTGIIGGAAGGLGAWSGQQIGAHWLRREPRNVFRKY